MLVFSDELTKYDFGIDHPMAPGRVTNTISLADQLGVLDRLTVVPPPPIDLARAARPCTRRSTSPPCSSAHRTRSSAWAPPTIRSSPVCMTSPDWWPWPASRPRAGSGTARRSRASNISGGLHHAMPDRTSGFCVYNDIAVAIRWLLDNGCERVGYVDVDVHHGDGVQAIFYDDPRVMTISLHETPAYLFPGTGWPHRDRRPGGGGRLGERRPAPRHQRRRLAAGLPRRGTARAARLPAQRAGHPARLRLASTRSAGRSRAQPRRTARLLPGLGRTGRRVVRGTLGVHGWRRLRRAPCGAAGLSPPRCPRSSSARSPSPASPWRSSPPRRQRSRPNRRSPRRRPGS